MKIRKGQKYRVLIQCHHFANEDETQEKGFYLHPEEEYCVEYVYEKNGNVFVNLGEFKDQYDNLISRTLNLDTFNSCFEEMV